MSGPLLSCPKCFAGGLLLPGVQPAQVARPVEYPLVGGNQLVTREGGGDDQTVGRVAVHIIKKAGPDGCRAVNGDFCYSLP